MMWNLQLKYGDLRALLIIKLIMCMHAYRIQHVDHIYIDR